MASNLGNLIIVILCINFSYISSQNQLDPKSLLTPPHTLNNSGLVSDGLLNVPQQLNSSDDVNAARTKRNPILGNNLLTPPSAGNSVEGLLASCQLTNLLLYQLLQQKPGGSLPLQSAGTNIGNNVLQPFPAVIQNSFTTLTTTSTYVTTLTSTDVVTIPLFFGNKPSPTTVTRTKTYEVTTSDVHTITTTIAPVVTSTVVHTIQPTPSTHLVEPTLRQDIVEIQEKRPESARSQFVAPIIKPNSVEIIDDFKPKQRKRKNRNGNSGQLKAQSQERKKVPKLNTAQSEDYYITGADRYDQYPENYQQSYHPTDYQEEGKGQNEYLNNYYAKRLKRRGEVAEEEGDDYDREYLLEPSYDASNLESTSFVEKCPPPREITTTATITVTKTVTKFVNPPASIISNSAINQNPQPIPSTSRTFIPSRSRNREQNFRREYKPQTTPSPTTTEATIRSPEGRRRGRSREAVILARNPSPFTSTAESHLYAQTPAFAPEAELQRISLRNSRSRSRFSPTGYS